MTDSRARVVLAKGKRPADKPYTATPVRRVSGEVEGLRQGVASLRNVAARDVEIDEVSATDARNEFAHMLETVARRGLVVITKQSAPRAVLLSFDEFRALVTRPPRKLDTLTAEFDAMLDRMQKPVARAGMKAAFGAAPAQLGAAAVAGARRRRPRG